MFKMATLLILMRGDSGGRVRGEIPARVPFFAAYFACPGFGGSCFPSGSEGGGHGDYRTRGERGDCRDRAEADDYRARGDHDDYRTRGERGDCRDRDPLVCGAAAIHISLGETNGESSGNDNRSGYGKSGHCRRHRERGDLQPNYLADGREGGSRPGRFGKAGSDIWCGRRADPIIGRIESGPDSGDWVAPRSRRLSRPIEDCERGAERLASALDARMKGARKFLGFNANTETPRHPLAGRFLCVGCFGGVRRMKLTPCRSRLPCARCRPRRSRSPAAPR